MTRLPAVWRLLAVVLTLLTPIGFAATVHAALFADRLDWALVVGTLTAVDAAAAGCCLAAGERAAPATVDHHHEESRRA